MPTAFKREFIRLSVERREDRERQEEITCTGPELAEILGFECDRRIRQLCEEGMPRSGRGRYPRNRCVQWYAQYMWNSALRDRRFCDMRVKRMKEIGLAFRTKILEAKAERAEGTHLHKNTCRRLWMRDLRRIEVELDRLAVDIADDPRLAIQDPVWWGQICARFDQARKALRAFKDTRANLFGAKIPV